MKAAPAAGMHQSLVFLGLPLLFSCASLRAQSSDNAFQEVPFGSLSDRSVSALGQQALAVRSSEWKHAETTNFVFHFFENFVAAPASVEAEFYYTIIARELSRDTSKWERKCHIFIFDQPSDWQQFQSRGQLDPWTGGLHTQGELFVLRNAQRKWKGHTLGHEIAHLVMHRFFGNGVPRWLNEGFAEYAGSRGYAAFYRARGYRARPFAAAVDPQHFIPLAQLTTMLDYPTAPDAIAAYYDESERLVRFLSAADKPAFATFLESMAQGARFESALLKGYGNRFPSLEALEREFKEYATREHGTSLQER